MLSVEIVVHGEPAHLETVGDVFYRLAQGEGSESIEATHDVLLADADTIAVVVLMFQNMKPSKQN